jgi:hypothetical protein
LVELVSGDAPHVEDGLDGLGSGKGKEMGLARVPQ